MWKCYVGQPIEFSGTYGWGDYHGGSMLGFMWETNQICAEPPSSTIGSGFSVRPRLVHHFPTIKPGADTCPYPSLPSDVNLIVTGPGLPPDGKEVKLPWAEGPCLGPALPSGEGKLCRQFLGMNSIESSSSGVAYTTSFVSGYSEQGFGKTKGNTAFWRVCIEGPEVRVLYVDAARPWRPWSVLKDLLLTGTPLWVINKVEQAGESDCDVSIKPSLDELEKVTRELTQVEVPHPYAALRREALEKMEVLISTLRKVDELIERSNSERSSTDRVASRAGAMERLAAAEELQVLATTLLEELDAAAGSA